VGTGGEHLLFNGGDVALHPSVSLFYFHWFRGQGAITPIPLFDRLL
jgi:hypothetical protein